ncbi:MAG: DUF5691 domain-containing protein, partial [Nakamurella sp.]
MTARPDLVTAATVGTAHRSVDLHALPDQLRPDPLSDDSAEALLDAAALFAVARRTVPPVLAAAGDDHANRVPQDPISEKLPLVPSVVGQLLGRLTNQPAVLLEALDLIRRAGLRLPPALVPGLLDDARFQVVAATRPVSGEIGRLLMAKNPRWTPPATPDPTDRSIWDEGTTAQRRDWLRAYRRIEPNSARVLLAETFSREAAGNRAELLEVLADGLSAADEDFLLAALADRSRVVIEAATALLIQLPQSALRRDMRTLAARHLTLTRRLLRTPTIGVTELDSQEFAPWPIPEGNLWTVLISRIDPAEWPRLFGGDLMKLVASGSAELAHLQSGFRLAAITFRHAGLANVLVTQKFDWVGPKAPPIIDRALWALLSPADATAQLDRLLTHRSTLPDHVTSAATAFATPWPGALARRFTTWLPAGGHAGVPAPRQLWDLLASATALPDCR